MNRATAIHSLEGFVPNATGKYQMICRRVRTTVTGLLTVLFVVTIVAPPVDAVLVQWATSDGGNGHYVAWRNNEGQSVTLPNDVTPVTVTEEDYEVWMANFDNGFEPQSVASAHGRAIPEPGAFALIICMLPTVSAVFRRKQE
jgi:hypothetical protein